MPSPKKSNQKNERYEFKRVIGYEREEKAIKKSFMKSTKMTLFSNMSITLPK